jgi:hypothetical protein
MTTCSQLCSFGKISTSLRFLRYLLFKVLDSSFAALRFPSVVAVALVTSLTAVQIASAQSTNYPATILSNKPVAYYQLQELPGATTAIDSSPNHLDATYEYDANNLTPELGLPGIDTNSIEFLGTLPSGYGIIDIPFNALLAPVAKDGTHGAAFSIECWAKAASDNVTSPETYQSLLGMFGIYGSGAYANASGWLLGQSPGPNSTWLFNMKNGGFLNYGAVVPLQWTHLVGTYDGTNQIFYIDGQSVDTFAASGYLADNGSDGMIGAVPNAVLVPSGPYSTWDGGVDDVAFYTNALTPTQVSNDYAVGLSAFSRRPYPPTVLVEPGQELVITNYAFSNIGTISFTLAPNTPPGADLTTNGVFTWAPTCEQGSTTNLITVLATDSSDPAVSNSMTFTVIVGDCVQVSIGSSVQQVGHSTCVPVNLYTTASLTNLNFTLVDPTGHFTNWSITATNAMIGSASAERVDPLHVRFNIAAQTGQILRGSNSIGSICADVLPGPSAFVPLEPSNLGAEGPENSPITNFFLQAGRVVVIGPQSLLDAIPGGNPSRALTLYGNPGMNYNLLSATNLAGTVSWSVVRSVTLTDLFDIITLGGNTNQMQFYKADQP